MQYILRDDLVMNTIGINVSKSNGLVAIICAFREIIAFPFKIYMQQVVLTYLLNGSKLLKVPHIVMKNTGHYYSRKLSKNQIRIVSKLYISTSKIYLPITLFNFVLVCFQFSTNVS